MRGQSTEECVARVAASGKMSQADARNIIEGLAERAEEMRKTGIDDPVVTAAWDAVRKIKDSARDTRLAALRNASIRNEALARIDAEGGLRELQGSEKTLGVTLGLTGLRGGTKAGQVIRSMLYYVPGASLWRTAEGMDHYLSRAWISRAENGLRQAGVLKAALSGSEDRGVAEAFRRMSGSPPDPRYPVSNIAQKIADVLHPLLEESRVRLNNEGARIGNAIDHITRGTWDSRQLRLAAGKNATREEAYQAWRARDVPRMAEKTFEDALPGRTVDAVTGLERDETMEEARERMVRSIYDATESGVHKSYAGDEAPGYTPPAFEGTRNLARSVSHQRVVYWKDSQAFYDHQREFGGAGSIYRQVSETLTGSARKTALMHNFGTNPQGNFTLLIDAVKSKYRTSDNKELFDSEIEHLQNALNYLDGSNNLPVNEAYANLAETYMAWQAARHLGGVTLTHAFAAPATVSGELAHHGVSRLATFGNIMRAILTGAGPAERREILADAGAFALGAHTAINRYRVQGTGLPGWISFMMAHYMTVNPLPKLIDRIQTEGARAVLMRRLGAAAGGTFDRLIPEQQEILRHYQINEPEWDMLRAAPGTSLGTERYMSPRDALAVPDAVVTNHLLTMKQITPTTAPEVVARAVARYRWDLGDRVGMYLNDTAEHATVTPGARERALAFMGRPGSRGWLMSRLFYQFKIWSMAAANQQINREIASTRYLSGGRVAWNIGTLLTLSTVMGAMRMATNDALVGNPQRDFTKPLTLLAAMAQGGGIGIYGDFLFGEISRLGSNGLAVLSGPAGSDTDRLMRIAGRFTTDLQNEGGGKALQHLWPELAHFGVGLIPFANLVYLKGALDYMLWYHLYNTVDPNWWRRTNMRLQKETGRTMMGYRPGGSVPWGVPPFLSR
jgi:hypothetical protein